MLHQSKRAVIATSQLTTSFIIAELSVMDTSSRPSLRNHMKPITRSSWSMSLVAAKDASSAGVAK